MTSLKTLIILVGIIVLVGVWLVDTNNKWLAEKEAKSMELPVLDVAESEYQATIECMKMAGDASGGDYNIYRSIMDECV